MTVKDEIWHELRKGTAFSEIRKKFGSQSQLCEATGQFLDEANKIVTRARGFTSRVFLGIGARRVELGVWSVRVVRLVFS